MAEKISTRAAYGKALCEFGANPDVVAVEADLSICTMSCDFREKYPERHFNVGIAENNMVDVAAGFAAAGKIPFCHSFAVFTAGRSFDMVRNTVAFGNLNVKLIGSHGGVTTGEDGPTHQSVEDLAIMRAVPNMVVIHPCDANETREAVRAAIEHAGPVYIRTGRTARECVTQDIDGYRFEIGKGALLREGGDVTIIAIGLMAQEALKAAEILAAEGISSRVIDMHTVKPLDEEIVLKAARETGAIVTAEEHSVIGGLNGAVAQTLSAFIPTPLERVGLEDCFGKAGEAEALLKYFDLTPENVAEKARRAIARKLG